MDTYQTSLKLKHFEGLYGDLNHRPDAAYIFLEAIETRSKEFDWIIDPHVHSHLYQIFFIESGSVIFTGSQEETINSAPSMLFVPPNCLHGLQYSTTVNGQILTLTDKLLEILFSDSPAVLMILEKLKFFSFSGENLSIFSEIMYLVKAANQELFADYPEKKLMLDSILKQLFLIIYRIAKIDHGDLSGHSKSLEYYARFQKIIKKEESRVGIPSIAKTLGITPAHLNRICKKVSGKSTVANVNDVKIQKAQNYLAHTSYTVSEIAFLLHFEYQNHFAKVFKKVTGMSPVEYRKSRR